MSCLALNCRGLGEPWAVRELLELIREESPSLVFLAETKLASVEMTEIIKKTKGYKGVAVDSAGRAGGLCLMWKGKIKVKFLSSSLHHIDCLVELGEAGYGWRCTGFYGWWDNTEKFLSWRLLEELNSRENYPWMVWGDFNEVMFRSEHRGKGHRSNRLMEEFRTCLENCGLEDLGYIGEKYTFSNLRDGCENTMSRIDRAVSNLEWIAKFLRARVFHLDWGRSDHRPIKVTLNPQRKKGGKPFRFEDCWADKKECWDIVDQTWKEKRDEPKGFMEKILRCGQRLKVWGRMEYRKENKLLAERREELQKIVNGNMEETNGTCRKEVLKEIDTLLLKDEIRWVQRARFMNLREGDRNSKMFFARANAREKRNEILEILDDQGVKRKEWDEIEETARLYFCNMFGSSNPEVNHHLLACIENRISEEVLELINKPFERKEVLEVIKKLNERKALVQMELMVLD